MIDLSKTRFIVTAYPDHKWPVEIIWWIESLMREVEHRADYRDSLKKRNIVCARNAAIYESALCSSEHFEHFVFIDADVRPGPLTSSFLELETDVKCCQVPQGPNKYAWIYPDSFHDALWCTRRDVLSKLQPPCFWFSYNEKHTEMLGCLCQSFREKVLEAGFSISHGGWAEHDRDGSWC